MGEKGNAASSAPSLVERAGGLVEGVSGVATTAAVGAVVEAEVKDRRAASDDEAEGDA